MADCCAEYDFRQDEHDAQNDGMCRDCQCGCPVDVDFAVHTYCNVSYLIQRYANRMRQAIKNRLTAAIALRAADFD